LATGAELTTDDRDDRLGPRPSAADQVPWVVAGDGASSGLPAVIVDSAQDAIVATTLEGVIALWNGGAERIFGHAAAEALGHPIGLIVPPDRMAEDEAVRRRVCLGEAVDPFETVRRRKGGALVSVSLALSPIRDASGRIIGVSGIARDITERKQAEDRAAHLALLECRARAELEAASRSKDEFLAVLSHELRNPLGSIGSAVHVLGLVGPHDERAVQAREVIGRQIRHAVRLVDDLLDVARIAAGRVILSRQRLELGGCVDQSLAALVAAGRMKNHRVSFAAAGEVWIDADPTRVEQVVTNLLDNAVKYTPPGGAIDVRVRAEPHEAVVSVADTGIGISADALPRLFELFVQGEPKVRSERGGLGIGLHLVQRLVSLHGGSVKAASAGPGLGSEFVVRFPRVSAPEFAAAS
jgi:PAS domain S-box-containing protein